ncbi:hypothetical protein DOTSEDRAFT_24826 [Dothistroma septosporum NZE10]|uniref:DUF7605 domain-containing protein n=1 Tax=Dothistroma septosporum (strain NZE10 / CBS 128990) TaxID=675120 RepID=M2XJY5_DOTSN|nr:hypothetical protein DOTSEDRAFT_24826 [Dothistroma septosporum NZE10]
MHAEQEVALANVVEFVKIQLQRIPDELNLLPSAVPLPQMRIKALLDAYCVRITAAYESRVGQMNKKLSNIKLDASKDVCSAYFTSSMRPMYECAKLESGNGCTNRMRNLLEHKLTKQPSRSQLSVDSENPFDAVREGLDVDLTATATWVAHKVKSDIKSILREMESSFDGFLQKQAESHDERNARRALGPFLAGAMRQVEAITAELEQIKGGERM